MGKFPRGIVIDQGDGLPLKLHTAASKADVIDYLDEEPGLSSAMAVAFIDVVMETDSAGLDLCEYIREELKNKRMQLFIRTGQPGLAPRAVQCFNLLLNNNLRLLHSLGETRDGRMMMPIIRR